MLNCLLLLSLGGLAANVKAHPHMQSESGLSSRRVNLDRFRMSESGNYVPAIKVKGDKPVMNINERGSYLEIAKELVKTKAPDAEYRLVNDHYVGSNGVAHVYFKQTLHGIDIDNADLNVNVGKDGKVFSYGSSFFHGKAPKDSPLTKRGFSDPAAALNGAIKTLNLEISTKGVKVEPKEGKEHFVITGTSGAVSHPEARLVYLRKKTGELALTWRIETDVRDNWLLSYVDAYKPDTVHNVVDYVSDLATFQVYPWDVNDPTLGSRKTLTDPWNTAASPFTWLSDGETNYTTTRGNNAIAQDNPTGGNGYLNNHRPNSPNLKFEYPYSPTQSSPQSYRDASITQLFYTANKYHDLLYILGFDEKAGNFQKNNNGKGGVGNDFVILNSQDGSGTNNANFATPPDGSSGRMRMYLWTRSNPQRDGCFDANVVLHEYTHGLSTRLTGGPNNSGCLNGLESGGMGEGWSDFMATAIRIKSTDTRNVDYTVGSWVSNKPGGIRQYPYSTNMQTNPMTYGTVNDQNEVHAIGTVWCTVLYETIWNLIDKHGITGSDFPEFDSNGVPKDGRYLAMKIVMGGMALQPCNPDMVSARDAILDADKSLTGGSNQCELWKGFAKRGLGQNAEYDENQRTEDFTVPAGVCSS
ncbi:hypothetical protein QQS21_006984 [Conoideocrella luteorostrata]|uniref:Extracellular metalloproteinase n=1 Tax=Conoideocrella luteorostrata TaxID=1105319 RepID=A0AAJ0CLN8_9HYPO|nr:hypothetical protein QQS21_006984 [Conoideocrella luteorostrata]